MIALLSAATGAWLSAHHIIQTDDGTAVIRKRYLTFDNTKVDIRQWDYQAFQANAEVTKAMTAQGYGDLVKQPPIVVETRKGMLGRIKDWGPVLSDKTQQAGTTLGSGLRKAGSATASGAATAARATGDYAHYVVSYWSEKLL